MSGFRCRILPYLCLCLPAVVATLRFCVPVCAVPVEAELLDGTVLRGVLRGVEGEGGAVTVLMAGDDGRKALSADELLSLRFHGPATRPASTQAAPGSEGLVTLWLNDGSRLSGRIADGDEGLLLDSPAGRFALSLTDLAAMRFGDLADATAARAFEEALGRRKAGEDVLLLHQEGRITSLRGKVETLTAVGGTFAWRGRTAPIRPERTCGVVFALPSSPTPPLPLRCVLLDGSVLAGRLLGGSADEVNLEFAGKAVSLPLAQLREIAFVSSRVTWLSDLEPAAYHFEPLGAARWPYRRDRSVTNGPIRIAEASFDRGIGMHAPASLEYALAEPYRLFVAVVGIDAAAAPRGHVVFRVLADGQERFNSGPVTGRDPPRLIRVPIDGARSLMLRVEAAGELDIGDHADWAAARLVR